MRHIIRHGKGVPTADQLDTYQLGISTTTDKLYIKNAKGEVVVLNDFASEPLQPTEKRVFKLNIADDNTLHANLLTIRDISIVGESYDISFKPVIEHGSQSDYLRLLFKSSIKGLRYDLLYQVHNPTSSSGIWSSSSAEAGADGYTRLLGTDGLALNGFVSSMTTMPLPYRVEGLLTIDSAWFVKINFTFTVNGVFLEIINVNPDSSSAEISE